MCFAQSAVITKTKQQGKKKERNKERKEADIYQVKNKNFRIQYAIDFIVL